MEPESESRSARYCAFVSRHAGKILLAAALVFGLSTYLASRLELRTAFSELLPSNDPGVVALEKTQARIGDMSLLLVGIHSPDRDANVRYAEKLTQKLLQLPKNTLALATYHVRDIKAFFQSNKWLYVSEPDLTEIRDRLTEFGLGLRKLDGRRVAHALVLVTPPRWAAVSQWSAKSCRWLPPPPGTVSDQPVW